MSWWTVNRKAKRKMRFHPYTTPDTTKPFTDAEDQGKNQVSPVSLVHQPQPVTSTHPTSPVIDSEDSEEQEMSEEVSVALVCNACYIDFFFFPEVSNSLL